MRCVMSHSEEFEALAVHQLAQEARETGGFSVFPMSGNRPVDGYMVGVKGYEMQVGEFLDWPEIIGIYADLHERLFREEGCLLGGWVHGRLYLDVSVRVPNKDEALRLAAQRGELAIYDVATGEVINVDEQGNEE